MIKAHNNADKYDHGHVTSPCCGQDIEWVQTERSSCTPSKVAHFLLLCFIDNRTNKKRMPIIEKCWNSHLIIHFPLKKKHSKGHFGLGGFKTYFILWSFLKFRWAIDKHWCCFWVTTPVIRACSKSSWLNLRTGTFYISPFHRSE